MKVIDLYWKRLESMDKRRDVIHKLGQKWLDQDITTIDNSK